MDLCVPAVDLYQTLFEPPEKLVLSGSAGEFTLEEGLVGSEASEVSCCIVSSFISRKHARVFRKGGKWYLEDLHSTNGTWINGKNLIPECAEEIRRGDWIKIADAVLQVKRCE